jgi:uncharacterized protein (DUF1778 family)
MPVVYTEGAMPGTRTKERSPRDVAINLRANQRQRALIDRAADAVGKNRSDFMLEAACRAADAVLLDRRLFVLDERPIAALSRRSISRRRTTPAYAAC